MRPSPMSPIGMTSISVSAMPLPCAHSISEGISSSLRFFSATALILTARPAERAASMPPRTLSRSPQRVMARNLAASRVSSETLMRRTPQSRNSPAKRASCEPLVVSVSSLSAPVSRWRDSERTSDITLRRTSGSPPVKRSFRTPLAMNAEQSRSSSSSVSKSALGRKVMSSDMQ